MLENDLLRVLGTARLRRNEPMSRHTTFRVGGPADFFAEPGDARELAAVLMACREAEIPYYIIGNGSNLLVGDGGYRGVIIALGQSWSEIMVEENRIRAGAGALLTAVARRALEESLEGLAFASGIPGSVGGAVVMNAGAYGSDISAVLRRVTVLTREGERRLLEAAELALGYRESIIPAAGYIVLDAEFALEPGDREAIRDRMDELARQRRSKQPLEYPSAGSTFKRPPGQFAGKLIEEAGLRGFCVGDAQVSEKHCGFVINHGGATAAQIMRLCEEVRRRVWEHSGVGLEMEVKLLGEF
ncbi:MAG: UDP-N-acetylmuramate dehydrogenase [Clostridiales bacterium]|nr:UDP-N-acetylmuramate dehydrogenase [Clostridiales bacterium]